MIYVSYFKTRMLFQTHNMLCIFMYNILYITVREHGEKDNDYNRVLHNFFFLTTYIFYKNVAIS
jgi:hypothetical protein